MSVTISIKFMILQLFLILLSAEAAAAKSSMPSIEVGHTATLTKKINLAALNWPPFALKRKSTNVPEILLDCKRPTHDDLGPRCTKLLEYGDRFTYKISKDKVTMDLKNFTTADGEAEYFLDIVGQKQEQVYFKLKSSSKENMEACSEAFSEAQTWKTAFIVVVVVFFLCGIIVASGIAIFCYRQKKRGESMDRLEEQRFALLDADQERVQHKRQTMMELQQKLKETEAILAKREEEMRKMRSSTLLTKERDDVTARLGSNKKTLTERCEDLTKAKGDQRSRVKEEIQKLEQKRDKLHRERQAQDRQLQEGKILSPEEDRSSQSPDDYFQAGGSPQQREQRGLARDKPRSGNPPVFKTVQR